MDGNFRGGFCRKYFPGTIILMCFFKLKLPSFCLFDCLNAKLEEETSIFINKLPDLFDIAVIKNLYTLLFHPYYHARNYNR